MTEQTRTENQGSDIAQMYANITLQYMLFHFIMLLLSGVEAIFLFLLLSLFPQSYLVAILLSALLVTLLTYAILNSYFQTKKPEQYRKLTQDFMSYTRTTSCDENDHFSMGKACFRFSNELGQKLDAVKDNNLFMLCPFKKLIETLLFKEKYILQEMFTLHGIYAYHNMIKENPSDLRAHTALANAYLLLSELYLQVTTSLQYRNKQKQAAQHKYTKSIHMAIEELKLLDEYAPNDPWVHAHLASCYRQLKLKEEEIKEYEILKNLCPEDGQILGKLGKLYFELGSNAKAMRIYDKLKKIDEKEAKTLIHFYDLSLKERLS